MGPWSGLHRQAPPLAQDLAWYGALVLAGTLAAVLAGSVAVPDLLLVPIGPLPVLARRVRPGAALVAATVLLVLVAVGGRDSSVEVTSLAVVLVTAMAADPRLRPVPVFLLAGSAVAAASALDARRLGQAGSISAYVFGVFGTALAIGLGLLLRRHRAALTELAATNARLAERNAELDRLRVAEADAAVASERTRIARELHDVVSHHVAGIAVRAGAAAHVYARRPQEAPAALRYCAAAAGETLSALRSMVGLLRSGDEPDLAPQPGLAQLSGLVRARRDAGQQVRLRESGPPLALADDLQLTAYRIVQEALTNALRHAPGSAVQIDLEWRPAALVGDGRQRPCRRGRGSHARTRVDRHARARQAGRWPAVRRSRPGRLAGSRLPSEPIPAAP